MFTPVNSDIGPRNITRERANQLCLAALFNGMPTSMPGTLSMTQLCPLNSPFSTHITTTTTHPTLSIYKFVHFVDAIRAVPFFKMGVGDSLPPQISILLIC